VRVDALEESSALLGVASTVSLNTVDRPRVRYSFGQNVDAALSSLRTDDRALEFDSLSAPQPHSPFRLAKISGVVL
jgi:hypothetical protein